MKLIEKFIAGATLCAFVATPVMAAKAENLGYLNGMRSATAEDELRSLGFRHVDTHKERRGYANSYWWDGSDDDCVLVRAYDGTVASVSDATDQDCGHHKGASAALGAAVGAAILGGLLAHKSHHKEGKEYDRSQTNEFDRGYTDGLHHAQYHNYNRSDAYSHGYERGADEREANLRHHHRRGGYSPVAQFKDVEGMTPREARRVLNARGFVRVGRNEEQNTRYITMWRAESRQCIQLTIADRTVYGASDAGRQPECR